jgi:hypothetical protein
LSSLMTENEVKIQSLWGGDISLLLGHLIANKINSQVALNYSLFSLYCGCHILLRDG